MPIIKEVPYGSALYDEVVELRRELLRRPLGLDFTPEELAQEKHDTHLAALDADRVVGTLLLRKVDERTARIMRMAVVPEAQGRAIGRALVEWAEGIARERGFETIMMHARSSAIGFYEKCGYHTAGDEFLEHGIPHIRMEKRLRAE
ncbi:MAG: GNAT family N-acetyltransferase [Gammaproteobacteria bacterium]